MQFEKISIESYKCFDEPQTITFGPRFNLLVGTNNAGKSSVFDTLSLQHVNDPHRSKQTIPNYRSHIPRPTVTSSTVSLSVAEYLRLNSQMSGYLPLTLNDRDIDNSLAVLRRDLSLSSVIKISQVFSEAPRTLDIRTIHSIGSHVQQNDATPCAKLKALSDNKVDITFDLLQSNALMNDASRLGNNVYKFNPQRRPGSECSHHTSVQLDSEAVYLPYWVNHLHSNDPHGHKILCEWLQRVFPQVVSVTAPPTNNNTFRLQCNTTPAEDRRDDLSVEISKMGTGIGNVLAILLVVLTARHPQVIAIDEPNAFLHPRALRELLAILEVEDQRHQYILTAHSADVLTSVNASSVAMLRFDGTKTTVRNLSSANLHETQAGLSDLGIRLTDLHARDRVLWVEGKTEEIVLPTILKFFFQEVAAGTAILQVPHTSHFDQKGREADVVEIYNRLSVSSALVPPMVCVLLDKEARKPRDVARIETQSNGSLVFLDRRMIESYLLSFKAIGATLRDLGESILDETVESALEAALSDQKLETVDAVAILKQLFSSLSETRHEFRKTRDVPRIVEWLTLNDPEALEPLVECLKRKIPALNPHPSSAPQ